MSKQKKMGSFFFPAVVFLILAAGCASLTISPSGFLSDYQRLKPESTVEGIYWWELPGVPWEKYTRLLIDPIEIRIDPTKTEPDLNKEEAAKMAGILRQAVIEAMKDRYPLAAEPGPDVLRIRAALTHLKPVAPFGNIVSTIILGVPVDVGEAAVEVQFIDSQTNQVLSELMASKKGSIWAFSEVWNRWTQVETAFKTWAQQLRAAMDAIPKTKK